jgi:hypothetical protein
MDHGRIMILALAAIPTADKAGIGSGKLIVETGSFESRILFASV